MRKNKITQQDYLKAHRKASREEEIALHGKSIRRSAVHRSKKIYNRKRMKAGIKILPFSFERRDRRRISGMSVFISVFAKTIDLEVMSKGKSVCS